MGREEIIKSIEEAFAIHAVKLKFDSSLNFQDRAIVSEDVFCELINAIQSDAHFVNQNLVSQNAAGFDLVDRDKGICVQVTKDTSRKKVQHTLTQIGKRDEPWHVILLFLTQDHPSYRKPFEIPGKVTFDPNCDVLDLTNLLRMINVLPMDRLVEVKTLVELSFDYHPIPKEIPSSLVKVVAALSSAGFGLRAVPLDKRKLFSITKKMDVNGLQRCRRKISDNAAYITMVDGLYQSYSAEGSSEGIALLESIAEEYDCLAGDCSDGDQCFFNLIDVLSARIEGEPAVADISREMRRFCISVLVVDAFTRCKIFDPPYSLGVDDVVEGAA